MSGGSDRGRRWVRALEVGAAVTGAVAAASVAGVAARRSVQRARVRGALEAGDSAGGGADGEPGLGRLRGEEHVVHTGDGVPLHVEVDQPGPDADPTAPTLVFVHGYVLSLESWHFQRLALRGQYRMVFFDLRSHGRSGRSDSAHTTLEQLGRDLAQVLAEVVPDGPVVLVGHSMGGMTVMSLAEQLPELVAERVVGAAFLATSAGGVGRLLPGAPGRVLDAAQPLLLATLARVPAVIDSGRRRTSFALTSRLAFGGPAPESCTDFVDTMISATPSQVIWDFLPSLRLHRRYGALAAYAELPTLVVTGDSDAILPLRHSRRIVAELHRGQLLVVAGAGHMVLLERPAEVERALRGLLARVASL